MLTVVLPVHNERDNLEPLLVELERVLASQPCEIIFVDDASTDGSLAELRRLAASRSGVRFAALRERVGQSGAIAAGLDLAQGDLIATMDADGQNDPADLPALLQALAGDSELAGAVGYRVNRSGGAWRLVQSRIANTARNWITGDRVRDTGCSLKVFRRSALASIPRFDGMHRFLPTLVRFQGHRVIELPVRDRPRRYGSSKYGMWQRLWRGLRDAFGVRWLGRRRLTYPRGERA